MVETRVRLPVGLAEASGGEVVEIVAERDAHADGEGGSAGRASVALGLRKQSAGDAVAAEIRVHGEPPEVEVFTPSGREHATDEPAAGLGHDDGVIGEGGGDGLGGLAERSGFGLELAAMLLEGGPDEVGDSRALGGRGVSGRDIAGAAAQMPVCSGRWSSATKLLNFVVSPSKRSMTLLIGP